MQTTVSTKYQVVIPKEARKKIKIKPGQKMDVEVVENRVTFSPARVAKPMEYYYKKLGGIWEGVDIDKYLEEERNSWDD
ncbi:AbrB/MazE/SpoVT family DNA-binding domain-containing protein [Candidatus Daviesbacteria bacterium]|nr:AbrB/MazE/SpoVT family DNA-binding domain-containing protein [Candidatus Daviesbacteria bacterium]